MKYGARLFEPRVGCLLHFDGSASDRGAVAWFADPRCAVSYQVLITDDGVVHRLAPDDARAYHAGVCQPSDREHYPYADANSAFYGVAVAATDGDVVTAKQFQSVVETCVGYYRRHGWGPDEMGRITGHSAEAWPRGRKHDPEGSWAVPVLDVGQVRAAVATALTGSV